MASPLAIRTSGLARRFGDLVAVDHLDLAVPAFGNRYTLETHRNWLSAFYRRFFNNQFKRSCTADGPKVGMVALSPRGDWRMPSDAEVRSWLHAVADYEPYEHQQESTQ